MALLSLALLSLTLTSYVPHGPTVLLALLSLFTLTSPYALPYCPYSPSYVPDGPTVPGPTVPIHPN